MVTPLPPFVVGCCIAVIVAALVIICAVNAEQNRLQCAEEEARQREKCKYRFMAVVFLLVVVISFMSLSQARYPQPAPTSSSAAGSLLSSVDLIRVLTNVMLFAFAFVCLRSLMKCGSSVLCPQQPEQEQQQAPSMAAGDEDEKVSVTSTAEASYCSPETGTDVRTAAKSEATVTRQTKTAAPPQQQPVPPPVLQGQRVVRCGTGVGNYCEEMAACRRRHVVWIPPPTPPPPPPPCPKPFPVVVTRAGAAARASSAAAAAGGGRGLARTSSEARAEVSSGHEVVVSDAAGAAVQQQQQQVVSVAAASADACTESCFIPAPPPQQPVAPTSYKVEGQVTLTPVGSGEGCKEVLPIEQEQVSAAVCQGDQDVVIIKHAKDTPIRIDVSPCAGAAATTTCQTVQNKIEAGAQSRVSAQSKFCYGDDYIQVESSAEVETNESDAGAGSVGTYAQSGVVQGGVSSGFNTVVYRPSEALGPMQDVDYYTCNCHDCAAVSEVEVRIETDADGSILDQAPAQEIQVGQPPLPCCYPCGTICNCCPCTQCPPSGPPQQVCDQQSGAGYGSASAYANTEARQVQQGPAAPAAFRTEMGKNNKPSPPPIRKAGRAQGLRIRIESSDEGKDASDPSVGDEPVSEHQDADATE